MERSATNVAFSCLTIFGVIVLCLGLLALAGLAVFLLG